MKAIKGKMILTVAMAVIALAACEQKKNKVEADKNGVEIQSKKGGGMEINKNGMKMEGKNGGKMEVDKDGVEMEGKDKK
jgi:hypothetical protein